VQIKKLTRYAKYEFPRAKIAPIDASAGCGSSKTKIVTIIAITASSTTIIIKNNCIIVIKKEIFVYIIIIIIIIVYITNPDLIPLNFWKVHL